MNTTDRPITIAEAARILGVHPNTLRNWDRKGYLKAQRFGMKGERRYLPADVKRLQDSWIGKS